MTRTSRNLIVLVAVAAIALANGYAPHFAHAAPGNHSKSERVDHGGHDHQAAAHPCHDRGSASDEGNSATFNYCCAAACSAIAYIVPPIQSLEAPVGGKVSTILIEFLQSVTWSASDPPPRIV